MTDDIARMMAVLALPAGRGMQSLCLQLQRQQFAARRRVCVLQADEKRHVMCIMSCTCLLR